MVDTRPVPYTVTYECGHTARGEIAHDRTASLPEMFPAGATMPCLYCAADVPVTAAATHNRPRRPAAPAVRSRRGRRRRK